MARTSKKGVSKSAAIRNYKNQHPTSKPKEIAAELNRSGFKITPQYVSTILSGARKASRKGVRKQQPVVARHSSFERLLAAKQLVTSVGSVEAAQEAIAQYGKLMA